MLLLGASIYGYQADKILFGKNDSFLFRGNLKKLKKFLLYHGSLMQYIILDQQFLASPAPASLN